MIAMWVSQMLKISLKGFIVKPTEKEGDQSIYIFTREKKKGYRRLPEHLHLQRSEEGRGFKGKRNLKPPHI